MSRDILAAPWRLGDSPGARGAFADIEGARVMAVFAKTHDLAVRVTELHNAELARRAEAAGEAYERVARSDPWRMAGGTVEYALARLGARVLRIAPWLARIGG